MSSLREKILNSKDILEEKVRIDEWDVEILVKGMTGAERGRLIGGAIDRNGNMNFEKLYAEIVILCSYDPETNEKIFSQADKDVLNNKSGGALEKIAQVALRLSGISKEGMDEAEKN